MGQHLIQHLLLALHSSDRGRIGGHRNGWRRLAFAIRDQALWWHWSQTLVHGFVGRVDNLVTFIVNPGMNWVAGRVSDVLRDCVNPHMDWVSAVAVLAVVVVVWTTVVVIRTTVVVSRTRVVVARTTVVVILWTTSVWAMDWVGLVLGSSCLAGSSTSSMSSSDGLATTPWALVSIRGFTHLEGWYRN